MDEELQMSKKQKREAKKQEKMEARKSIEKKSKMKKIIGWGIFFAVMIGFAAFIVAYDKGGVAISNGDDSVWFKGNENAAVTLVEYSDFECPACASYYPFIKQLADDFPDDLKIVYRHFPLTSIHRYALPAARAAEAAGNQGKFWEMHDKLFENQRSWERNSQADEIFEAYAGELGLNLEQFRKDYNDGSTKSKVQSDARLGQQNNVTGTPSFFLNGRKISNPRGYTELKQLIQNEIASVKPVEPELGEDLSDGEDVVGSDDVKKEDDESIETADSGEEAVK